MLYKKKIISKRYNFDSYTLYFTRCLGKYGCFRCMFLVEDKRYGHKSCSLEDSLVYLTVCKDHNFNYYATEKTPNYNKE